MKYILLALLLAGCASAPRTATYPEVHYNDKFKIVKGFYTGCTGTAREVEGAFVRLSTQCDDTYFGSWFNRSDLEAL